MTTSFRNVSLTAALVFAFLAAGCSSSRGAEQTTPATAGKSSAGGSTASGGMGGNSGTGASSAGNGTAGSAEGGAAGDSGLHAEALAWLQVEGNQFEDPAGNAVILRGVDLIDLAATEEWEGGIDAMIDRLTNPNDTQSNSPSWATKVLRLAVVPGDSDIGTPNAYTPGTQYYEHYLRPTVDYAAKKGLYVIIDWHYIDDTAGHVDTTNAFWSDIAPHFANDSNVLFELYNEPKDSGNWTTTKTQMQGWYDLVRQSAPKNIVLVGTPNWSQLVGNAAQDPLAGTNIAYVAHMYPIHWQAQSLRDQITTAAALVPVFVTEWGFEEQLTMNGGLLSGTITNYGDPFKAFLEERNVSWSAWCASSSWGPPMFNADYTLRVGEGEMGGFVKDWLYERGNDDQPSP